MFYLFLKFVRIRHPMSPKKTGSITILLPLFFLIRYYNWGPSNFILWIKYWQRNFFHSQIKWCSSYLLCRGATARPRREAAVGPAQLAQRRQRGALPAQVSSYLYAGSSFCIWTLDSRCYLQDYFRSSSGSISLYFDFHHDKLWHLANII
jgi:hypothetical protein